MSKVTKRALEQTVIGLAIADARETAENSGGAKFPPEGTLLTVTELDRRLWSAALRLDDFKKPRPRRKSKP